MKIIVAGIAKSGTTALFFRLKNSLSGNVDCCFEPENYQLGQEGNPDHTLVKILVEKIESDNGFQAFDKKIYITRDIRDQLVSDMLYSTYHFLYDRPERHIKRCFELLKQKEASPSSVSMVTLFRHLIGLSSAGIIERIRMLSLRSQRFLKQNRDFFVVKYEDFVAESLDSLSSCLGFPLSPDGEVEQEFKRVERTKGSGDWKSWFTEEDITLLKESAEEFLEFFQYETENWRVSPKPRINPEHCSLYVQRVVNERRSQKRSGVITMV